MHRCTSPTQYLTDSQIKKIPSIDPINNIIHSSASGYEMTNLNSPGGSRPFEAKKWLEDLQLNGGPSNIDYSYLADRPWARWFGLTSLIDQCNELLKVSEVTSFPDLVSKATRQLARSGAGGDESVLHLLQSSEATCPSDSKCAEVAIWQCKELHSKGVIFALETYDQSCTPIDHEEVAQGLPDIFNFTRLYVQSFDYLSSKEQFSDLSKAVGVLIDACYTYSGFLLDVQEYAQIAERHCKAVIIALDNGCEPSLYLQGELQDVNRIINHSYKGLDTTNADLKYLHNTLAIAVQTRTPMLYTFDSLLKNSALPHSPEIRMYTLQLIGTSVVDLQSQHLPTTRQRMSSWFGCYTWFQRNSRELPELDPSATEQAMLYHGALIGLAACIAIFQLHDNENRRMLALSDQGRFDSQAWKAMHTFYSTLARKSQSSHILGRYFPRNLVENPSWT